MNVIKSFNVIDKKIIVSKPLRIYTHGGRKTIKKGTILWKETSSKPNSGWPVTKDGFVIEHYHGYGQNEVFPWKNIKLIERHEVREIIVKKSNKRVLTEKDFFTDKNKPGVAA